MARTRIVTLHLELRGEAVDVECEMNPAEPDVGIMAPYLDCYEVVGHPDWELNEDEEQRIFAALEGHDSGPDYDDIDEDE